MTNNTEMQGAKHVFTKKAKMASIAFVLEVYSEKPNIHKTLSFDYIYYKDLKC